MIGSFVTRCAIGLCAVGALAAGCSGPQSALDAPSSIPSAAAPAKAKGALLYVSSPYYGINVYTYPQGVLTKSFSDPGVPSAMCTDRSGNIYAAESYGQNISEYAHGGTQPIATIDDAHTPFSCSIDDAAKTLAVGNETGSVAIFDLRSVSKGPTLYSYSGVLSFFFCSYDAGGNLFAVGQTASGGQLFELKVGASALEPVRLPFKVDGFAPIQWDGTYLAVEGSVKAQSFSYNRVEVKNYRGKLKGRVTLKAAPGGWSEFWFQGGSVVAVDSRGSDISWWNYPAGGKPVQTIDGAGTNVVGIVVSTARQH
jgi:hypothetical protein